MRTLRKIENYMNREDAHGFSLQSNNTIMDVLIHITGNCDVTIYKNGKLTENFAMHRDSIVKEVNKRFNKENRSLCAYLFG